MYKVLPLLRELPHVSGGTRVHGDRNVHPSAEGEDSPGPAGLFPGPGVRHVPCRVAHLLPLLPRLHGRSQGEHLLSQNFLLHAHPVLTPGSGDGGLLLPLLLREGCQKRAISQGHLQQSHRSLQRRQRHAESH
eukprot:GHVL01016093.1.p2 GENE.GHVL01016093.1~~GHVL01016093.1.p2  ORF type:complete len:133 (+),score=11.96 GHVL01016093.1:343-741(+)